MKDIVWDKILSVGITEIDEDHHKLVHIFNILNHAITDGEPKDYLAATLEELVNCTVWHFSHEERLMVKHRFPEAAEHKAEHQELIQSAKELQQLRLQPDASFAEEHVLFLEQWLTKHIHHGGWAFGDVSVACDVRVAAERESG